MGGREQKSEEESLKWPQLGTGSQERWELLVVKKSPVTAAQQQPLRCQAMVMGEAGPKTFPFSPSGKLKGLSPNDFATWFFNTRSLCQFPGETCLSPFWSLNVQNKLPDKRILCSVVLSSILLQGQSQQPWSPDDFHSHVHRESHPQLPPASFPLPLIVVDILKGRACIAYFSPFFPILINYAEKIRLFPQQMLFEPYKVAQDPVISSKRWNHRHLAGYIIKKNPRQEEFN